MPNFDWIPDSMKVRSVLDLPTDDVQTDPLRRLVNHWRVMANSMSSTGHREGFVASGVAFELADQLTAILNLVDRSNGPNNVDAKSV